MMLRSTRVTSCQPFSLRFNAFSFLPSCLSRGFSTTTTQQSLYQEASDDCVSFWRSAAEDIEWRCFPQTIFNPHDTSHQLNYSWFADGTLNLTETSLDRHIASGRGSQTAIIHDSPVTNTVRHISYNDLFEQVELLSGAMSARGVSAGDRVLIYMPMIPEAIVSMFACARIGAIHSVVFGGFAAPELAKRIIDCEPKLVISASGSKEGSRVIEYKPLLDRALEICENEQFEAPKKCVIYQRSELGVHAKMVHARDEDWNDVLKGAERMKAVAVKGTHPLYILYTSGTTGSPKGIIRETAGHAVALRWTMQHFYGLNPGDCTFFASDIGWVVGHSYIVYGPLLQGLTTVMYEGKPIGTPDAGAFWRMVEQHQIKGMFAAPTAFRAIKKEDPHCSYLSKYDLSSLKSLFLAGERCDPNTLLWAREHLPDSIDVCDHWWQTETGWPITGRMFGDTINPRAPLCVGSGGRPLPGMYLSCVSSSSSSTSTASSSGSSSSSSSASAHEIEVDPDAPVLPTQIREVDANETGEFVLRLPLPPGTLGGLWRNRERCYSAYLEKYPGYYVTGDTGHIDEDGNVHVMSRVDDLINVAGHRLSTASMETVLAEHPSVAECCVIGVNDAIKGQVPVGVVVLKSDQMDQKPEKIEKECIKMVRESIGAVASFRQCVVVGKLPKTRSGKILRRSLREIYSEGRVKAVPATIEDAAALDEFEQTMARINKSKQGDKL